MTSVPLSNVLLPAVVISSAVFSALTVPFALIKSEPVVVEVPPFLSGEIQPIFNGEHNEVAIPYVGFAIVVSVGAGLISVEVNRKWQAYRESTQAEEPSPNLQQSSPDKEALPEALKPPEYRPEVSEIDLLPKDELFSSQTLTDKSAITSAQDIVVEAPAPIFDVTQLAEFQLTLPHQITERADDLKTLNLSSSLQENDSVQPGESQVSSGVPIHNLESVFNEILESRQQYQTCRIKVPHLERRLFAIEVNGEYYSFFRADPTKDKVLESLAKLSHRIQKTVITKTEKGYVIWVFEPEVYSRISK